MVDKGAEFMWIVEKKNIKKLLLFIVACLFILFVLVYVFLFVIGYIPYRREMFSDYDHFRRKANDFFLDKSPQSAEQFKYYWYKGYFDEIKAVSFDTDEKDYEIIKDYYKKECGENGKWGNDWAVNITNEMVTNDFIKEEELSFLAEISSEYMSKYEIIEYRASWKASDSRNMFGVIACKLRDDKYNIVLFDCKDAFPE